MSAAVAIGPTTVLLGGKMVDDTAGEIVSLISKEVVKTRSFSSKLDIRKCAIRDDQSSVLGAVAYALQEIDIDNSDYKEES